MLRKLSLRESHLMPIFYEISLSYPPIGSIPATTEMGCIAFIASMNSRLGGILKEVSAVLPHVNLLPLRELNGAKKQKLGYTWTLLHKPDFAMLRCRGADLANWYFALGWLVLPKQQLERLVHNQ